MWERVSQDRGGRERESAKVQVGVGWRASVVVKEGGREGGPEVWWKREGGSGSARTDMNT